MTYQTEFPDFPPADMPALPDGLGFVDTSWHNDACPSFTSDEVGLTIWVDFLDPAKSEFQDNQGNRKYPRFSAHCQREGIETSGPWVATNDWAEVLVFVEGHRAMSAYKPI